jgi:hypothetical protein
MVGLGARSRELDDGVGLVNDQETFLDALVAALRRAAAYNAADQVAPAVVLWPDEEQEWELLIPRLREQFPILTLGPYAPAEQCGPAPWVRCAVAGALAGVPSPSAIPVLYLPLVRGADLRDVETCPDRLQLLYELRFRGTLWTQPDGRDWTIAAFLSERRQGLGIEVRGDRETRKAMRRALAALATRTIGILREDAPWRARDFDLLAGFDVAQTPTIQELIAQGESVEREFKSTARWDAKQGQPNKEMEKIILKTVAAFLNSYNGGTLLIGVADDGTICGFEDDYRVFSKPEERDRDGYELWLVRHLLNAFGRDVTGSIRVTFHQVDGRDVCKVSVLPAPEPAFVEEKGKEPVFYVRTGNASNPLSVRDAIRYSRYRWPLAEVRQ